MIPLQKRHDWLLSLSLKVRLSVRVLSWNPPTWNPKFLKLIGNQSSHTRQQCKNLIYTRTLTLMPARTRFGGQSTKRLTSQGCVVYMKLSTHPPWRSWRETFAALGKYSWKYALRTFPMNPTCDGREYPTSTSETFFANYSCANISNKCWGIF